MSADNWTICPKCVKRAEDLRDAFTKKYYGKLDSFLYNKAIAEIKKAVEHVKGYGSDEFEPDEEILNALDEKDIKVELYGMDYEAYEILQQGSVSSCLREDYEQGINENDATCFMIYSCSCDCGFSKNFTFEESKHKIVEKVIENN